MTAEHISKFICKVTTNKSFLREDYEWRIHWRAVRISRVGCNMNRTVLLDDLSHLPTQRLVAVDSCKWLDTPSPATSNCKNNPNCSFVTHFCIEIFVTSRNKLGEACWWYLWGKEFPLPVFYFAILHLTKCYMYNCMTGWVVWWGCPKAYALVTYFFRLKLNQTRTEILHIVCSSSCQWISINYTNWAL